MARYIDVDALIAEIESNSRKTWSEDINTVFWGNAVKIKDNIKRCIERQPTADVVPRTEVEREILAELELFCNAAKADIARAQRHGLEQGLIGLAVSASGEISGVNRVLTFIEILKQKYGVTENG